MTEISYCRHCLPPLVVQYAVQRYLGFTLMTVCSGLRALHAAQLNWTMPGRAMTFRTTITLAVMAFITALTACLIFIQIATFHSAARAAASAAMDAASANTLSRLEADMSELSSFVRVLSSNPALADSEDRSEIDDAIIRFKAAL